MKGVKGVGSSGELISSQAVLDSDGWFIGAILTAGTGDAKVTIYDAADDDLGGKRKLAILTTDLRKTDIACTCREGIYVEISGDGECIVYYSM